MIYGYVYCEEQSHCLRHVLANQKTVNFNSNEDETAQIAHRKPAGSLYRQTGRVYENTLPDSNGHTMMSTVTPRHED